MKSIAQFSSPALMLPCLQGTNPPAVIGELSELLGREHRVEQTLSFYTAVMNRESLSPTAVPPGLALPHARIPGLSCISFALGRSQRALDWAGIQGVHLVFLFAVPDDAATGYLTLVSSLAKLSMDSLGLDFLLRAPDRAAMFEGLKRVPLRGPYVHAAAA